MKKNRRLKIFEAKYFGLVIGAIIFLIVYLIQSFSFFKFIDLAVLDTHFNLRSTTNSEYIQAGASETKNNLNVSNDILILGVDTSSLARFGRWPWTRFRHADFLQTLARIGDQNQRERAVLLDFFFVEPSDNGDPDSSLRDAIQEHGRTFLETIINPIPLDLANLEEYYKRDQTLYESKGTITQVKGDWQSLVTFMGSQSPLSPFGREISGYGHATFLPDLDQTFRRQMLVSRVSHIMQVYDVEEISPAFSLDTDKFQRLGWMDKNGYDHTVPAPLTEVSLNQLKETLRQESPPNIEDTNSDGEPDLEYYTVYVAQDYFVPSITLALALRYFNKSFSDIEVVIGKHIRIPSPQYFNSDSGVWEPYRIQTVEGKYITVQAPVLFEVPPGTWLPQNIHITPDQSLLYSIQLRPPEYKVIPEILIPIDNQGQMLINYMGQGSAESGSGNQTYPVRSYAGYAARATSADPATWPKTLALNNKIIMAGAFSAGIADDEKETPFGLMYGVEVHANALNTILMDKFIYSLPNWVSALILFGFCLLIALLAARFSTPLSLVAVLFLSIAYFISTTFIFEFQSIYMDFSTPIFGMVFTLLAVIVYRVMTEEREKKRIQTMFGKYVSKQVVDQMIERGEQPELGGVDKELTVLFSDIRGFTTLSESMTPQELVNHLNAYLTAMTDIILEYGGTLDKYVGDEIMCFWGAPLQQSNHAILSCKCALKQMQRLGELNREWPPEKRIDIGIGLNSGIMTVGNMGSLGRMNYTLMGDNVNLGARLEGTNKQYGTNIIISEYTYGLVKDHVIARELDNIRVKGKNRPVLIYELIDVV